MDGGHFGWLGRSRWCGVRSKIHVALDVLRASRCRKAYGAAAAQYVGRQCQIGGAVDYHRRWKVGRNYHLCRSALPTSAAHRGEEILALRPKRRTTSVVRRRTATAAAGGGADCRYERLQLMGGICRNIPPNPAGLSGA